MGSNQRPSGYEPDELPLLYSASCREQRYPSFRSASTPSSLAVGCSGPILCCCYNIIRLRCRREADTLRLLGGTFLFQPNLTLLGSNGPNIRISFICRSRRCARRTGEIISLNLGRFSKSFFEGKDSVLVQHARSNYALLDAAAIHLRCSHRKCLSFPASPGSGSHRDAFCSNLTSLHTPRDTLMCATPQ